MEQNIERHPWPPFIPSTPARLLFMGTFPPKPSRYSMEFYYPNKINDFWRIMGLLFYGDAEALYDRERGTFRLAEIKALLDAKGIAMGDTGAAVRRLKDNASDKYLEIVEPVDLDSLLAAMPSLTYIATTGEKAAGVIAELTGTEPPKMGESTTATWKDGRTLHLYRMPSTSRAYPLPLARKAEYYGLLLREARVLAW